MLGVTDVSNAVKYDEYFLSSVDLNKSTLTSSPGTRYLDKDLYVTEDGTMKNIRPYILSPKAQTHNSDTPTYKDILRLPEEERKLWDNSW